MTTFSAITTGQRDAESYIDTTLAGQWSNNVLAMFEGDASASAVRLQAAAVAKTIGSSGSQAISASSSWVPAEGLYMMAETGFVRVEIYVSAAWQPSALGSFGGHIWSDGTNMRIYNSNASSRTVYYHEMG